MTARFTGTTGHLGDNLSFILPIFQESGCDRHKLFVIIRQPIGLFIQQWNPGVLKREEND